MTPQTRSGDRAASGWNGQLPVPVVLAHGALAATTLVLVLLTAIGV